MCEALKTKVLAILPATTDGKSAGLDGDSWPDEALSATAEALRAGSVVALPTDTVYGLACLARHARAVDNMYDIKARDGRKPLAVCLAQTQDVYQFCKVQVEEAELLLDDLLPGPLTLVFERSDALPPHLNPFTRLVGVRVPDHGFLSRLCQTCGEPLALTSANISGRPSAVAASEFQDLWPRLAVVVDGGPIGDRSRLGSTVVDLSVRGKYNIVRRGRAYSSTVDLLERKYGLVKTQETSEETVPLGEGHASPFWIH